MPTLPNIIVDDEVAGSNNGVFVDDGPNQSWTMEQRLSDNSDLNFIAGSLQAQANVTLSLSNTPIDLASMATLGFDMRLRLSAAASDDTQVFTAQIFEGSALTTPLTNAVTVATQATAGTTFNNKTGSFTIQGTPTKAQWDNAFLRLIWTGTISMGNDGYQMWVSEIAITGTYSAVPAAITDLAAESAGPTSVSLDWTAPSPGDSAITNYQYQTKIAGPEPLNIGVWTGNTLTPASGSHFFQSFVANSSVINAVHFPGYRNQLNASQTVRIRTSRTGGTVLAEAETGQVGTATIPLTVTFPTPATVTLGQTYWIEMTTDGSTWNRIAPTDTYPDGQLFVGSTGQTGDMVLTVNPAPDWSTWTSTGSTSPNYTVTGLTTGASYDFQIRAVSALGGGLASNTATATPLAGDTTPPSTPTNFSITNTGSAVEAAWTAATDNVTSQSALVYEIARTTTFGGDPQDWPDAVVTPAGATSATLTLPTVQGTYYYRVAAIDAAGNYSDIWSDTQTLVIAPPAAPTLSSSDITPTSINIIATVAPGDNVTGVEFQRNTVTIQSGPLLSLSDTGLSTNTTYTYRARSSNASGTSAWSSDLVVAVQDSWVFRLTVTDDDGATHNVLMTVPVEEAAIENLLPWLGSGQVRPWLGSGADTWKGVVRT